MNRRDFLVRTGLLLSTGLLAGPSPEPQALAELTAPSELDNWDTIRAQFNLTRDRIHMASFLLASHPQPVREAIDLHRRGLDENPAEYLHENSERLESAVLRAAADYFGVQPTDIALTDSTTMGLGLLYGGLRVRADQEILTTTHDHYSTAMSLQLRAARTGAAFRQIPLYQQLATVSQEEIVETLVKALRPQTRIVAVTWVHSSTGLKLPIRLMAEALAKVNASRAEDRPGAALRRWSARTGGRGRAHGGSGLRLLYRRLSQMVIRSARDGPRLGSPSRLACRQRDHPFF